MLKVKDQWLRHIGQDTGVTAFDEAEDLFGVNLIAYQIEIQEPIPRVQRGTKITKIRDSCMLHEHSAHIALYKDHAMYVHNVPHFLDEETLTCNICNKVL